MSKKKSKRYQSLVKDFDKNNALKLEDAVKIIKPQTAGVYIINLTSEDYNISKKFIIVE